MGVVNCSTAAQFFHVLRRQMRRPYRKPLVVIAPKKLLKFAAAASNIEDFAEQSTFQRIVPEQNKEIVADSKVRKVILCSGQVYYDLIGEREKRQINDVAIIRVEQLSPWPFRSIGANLERYPNAEITWCQEETKNGGVWSFAEPRLRNQLSHMEHKHREIAYAGRSSNASPSTGFGSVHKAQLAKLLEEALK